MKHVKLYEDFINESSVIDASMEEMIKHIKDGYGWIDPYHVEELFFNMEKGSNKNFGMPFNSVKQEIWKRLMKADLLYFADAKDGEVKGKKVTSINQIK